MVAAVCSYLMPPNTLINKFYWRPQDRWDEFRTGAVAVRRRRPDADRAHGAAAGCEPSGIVPSSSRTHHAPVRRRSSAVLNR
jgi:hypothetical protein